MYQPPAEFSTHACDQSMGDARRLFRYDTNELLRHDDQLLDLQSGEMLNDLFIGKRLGSDISSSPAVAAT